MPAERDCPVDTHSHTVTPTHTGQRSLHLLLQISDWRRSSSYRAAAVAAASEASDGDDAAPETYLAQRYVDSPYLVGGRKFDLRIYALVTCYNPLRVYLYRWGAWLYRWGAWLGEQHVPAEAVSMYAVSRG